MNEDQDHVNSPEILSELTRKCDERHRHQQLLGSRAGPAARYPEGLCRAICIVLTKGLRNKECHVKKMLELTEDTTTGEIPEEETVGLRHGGLGRRHGESVGPQNGATGEVEGDEVREGERGVAADLPGRGSSMRMEGREDQVDRQPARRRWRR